MTISGQTEQVQQEKVYCEWCRIVPLMNSEDKYCMACINDIVEYLAKEWQEQEQVEKGWY